MQTTVVKWVSASIGTCLVASAFLTRGPILVAEEPSDLRALSVLTQKCVSCHSGDEPKGKLDLTTRENLVQGGDSGPAILTKSLDQSVLWQRVAQDEMPPKHPLTDEEKGVLKEWILAGALWSGGALNPLELTTDHRAGLDWWSLRSLQPVTIPPGDIALDRRQPIDDFIVQKLIAKNLTLSSDADRRVLIRRLSFDLLGLPPSPEEIHQFEQDERPDAFERLVDRLLASPHYGERWARHWLDVVRFGESNGFERDLPRPNAWPYRDWVIEALNRDLAYDEFVRWQLAGDLIAPDDAQAIKAVGFIVAGAHDTVVPVVDRMRAMMRQDELEDIVATVSQTFLGLTVNCARCHDHKFDPITTREYYQLASALSGVDHGEREFTPPAVTRQLMDWQARIDRLASKLRETDMPIRESIIADRAAAGSRAGLSRLPNPMAAWDFTRDLHDQVGDLHVKLIGSVKRSPQGLVMDGASFAATSRLPRDLVEKTLEVRLQLKTLQQAGGGAISVQTFDGQIFDAIGYGEQEPARWMAGSNGFVRTMPYQGMAEDQADKASVVITQVYQADGTIRAYRNAVGYGVPIRREAAVKFEAASSQVIFGLRHGTDIGGNRMLQGTIAAARLYDRALTPDEVAASADVSNTYVTEGEILAKLTPHEQSVRRSQQIELKELREKHAELTKNGPQKIYSAIATQPPAMKIHQRGSVSSLGDEVEPAGLSAIQGLSPRFNLRPDAIESHRRMQLANWITDARNPLFARVMTNRIWHYHFGAGLVDSPNDLGFHAGNPSHPELLEWLSSEFQGRPKPDEAGQLKSVNQPRAFSIKSLHRLLITSSAYRQSSAHHEAAAKVDAGNRLIWRMSPHRLEAEAVRDAMLSISGELNTEIGGRGYSDVNSYFFKGTQFYDPIDPSGHTNHRRTVYRMWARGGRSPFLDTFDCPDPSTTTPRRSATVTPLQALSLMNHSFSLRMADHFADRLTREAPSSIDAQIYLAYQLLYARDPDADELKLGHDFIVRRQLSAFCRAMWNTSEFLFVD